MTPFRTRNARRALAWWLFVMGVFGLAFVINGWAGVIGIAMTAMFFIGIVAAVLFFARWVAEGEIK